MTKVSIRLALSRFTDDQPITLVVASTSADAPDLPIALEQRGHGFICLRVASAAQDSEAEVLEEWFLVAATSEELERLSGCCYSLAVRDLRTILSVIAPTAGPGLKLLRITYPPQSFIEATIAQARKQ
ncbi:MAG: hypothetical protein GY811_23750 [Myxococcales bacterium]|nr:hypothetical protein [Myxococcales bacterium]